MSVFGRRVMVKLSIDLHDEEDVQNLFTMLTSFLECLGEFIDNHQ